MMNIFLASVREKTAVNLFSIVGLSIEIVLVRLTLCLSNVSFKWLGVIWDPSSSYSSSSAAASCS